VEKGTKAGVTMRIPTTREQLGLRILDATPKPRVRTQAGRKGLNKSGGGFGLHLQRIPHVTYEAWVSMAWFWREKVRAHYRSNQPNPYFEVNPQLVLNKPGGGAYTTEDEIINAAIYRMHFYDLAVKHFLTRIVNLDSFSKLSGSGLAFRDRVRNKFSSIRGMLVKLKGLPINGAFLDNILQNTTYLASHSGVTGHQIDIPYWLPIFDDSASTPRDPKDLTNTEFAGLRMRLPTLDQISGYTGSLRYVDSDDIGFYPRASTAAYGSLGEYLFSELDAALDLLLTEFQRNPVEERNIIHQNNAMLDLMLNELGILDGKFFDFADFSTKTRKEVKVVNRHEYYANLGGYMGEVAPVVASTLEDDMSPTTKKTLMGLPDSEVTADYLTDLDRFYASLTTPESELADIARMPYAALILTDAQLDAFKLTGELPDIESIVTGGAHNLKHVGLCKMEGAVTTDTPTTTAHYDENVGFLPKLKALRRMFGGDWIYENNPGDYFSDIQSSSGLIAMSESAIDNGILQPFYLVTPIKDVHDPLFWGSFVLLDKDELDVAGSWGHYFQNYVTGVGNVARIQSLTIANAAPYVADLNLFDPDVVGIVSEAYDVVGPFVGDGIDLVSDEYFARIDLSPLDMYPRSATMGSLFTFPYKPFIRDNAELSHYDDQVLLEGSSGSFPGTTLESERTEVNITTYDPNVALTSGDTMMNRLNRNIFYRFAHLIGRVPTKVVESYHLFTKNLIETFTGNKFPELIKNFAPPPAASAVSISLTVEQFLDIKEDPRGKAGANLKSYGKREFSGSSSNTRYSSKSSERLEPAMKSGSKRKRNRKKKTTSSSDSFSSIKGSKYSSNSKFQDKDPDKSAPGTFGDEKTPDTVDFRKGEGEST
jgi:hypothetical protein